MSIHATLALRHAIPTLLSPLRPIADDRDAVDDLQSNAWANAPPYRLPLTGLGITYLQGANLDGQLLAPEDPVLHMQVDDDDTLLSVPAENRGTDMLPDDFLARYKDCDLEDRGALTSVHCLCDERTSHLELGLDDDINPTASDVIGLIPDVNMYDTIRRLDLPLPGVNPLDTICSTSLHDIAIPYGEPPLPTLQDHPIDDSLPTMDSKAEKSPSPRVIQDIMSILIQPAPEFSFLPWPSAQSSSPSQQAGTATSIKPEPTNVPDSGPHSYTNTTHSSPVLNAHLGIELNELVSRAARFKTKFPERDIDRAWLSHFAGKLSDRGELLNDFRCYVIGCDQRNKRRDHILVHVGAHVGQRPFACSVCPLRFLRKNECKRHEASHSGFKPYSCDICGQSFVRQDLVKRHVKRTHGLRDENEPNVRTPSRRARRPQ